MNHNKIHWQLDFSIFWIILIIITSIYYSLKWFLNPLPTTNMHTDEVDSYHVDNTYNTVHKKKITPF